MNIIMSSWKGISLPVTPFIANLSVRTSLEDIYTTLEFDIPYSVYLASGFGAFTRVKAFSVRGFKFSGLVINTYNDNLQRVTITAVSDSFRLTSHEVLIKVNKFPASEVVKRVLSDFDKSLQVTGVPLTSVISKIYNGETVLGVIDDVIEVEEGATGRKIYRTFDEGVLKIFTDPLPYIGGFVLYPSMSSLAIEENGEDVKTKVKLYTENNKDVNVLVEEEDARMTAIAGTIQKVYKLRSKDKSEAKQVARNLLKIYSQIKATGSFTLFGDYTAKVGLSIPIQGHMYIISSVEHVIEDAVHLMNIGVIRYEK